jgi:hypothetical protein
MKSIWIVYEDNHGDVSYWGSKKKAFEEARNIIMQYPYHPHDGHEITKKEIKDSEIENYDFGVGVRKVKFNESWA